MKIEKGMFVRHGDCSIYFEVESIHGDFLMCANRDPAAGEELVFLSKITDVSEGPCGHWIKLNREKNFYDKFYPEGWQNDETKVIESKDLIIGEYVLTEKGACQVVKKLSGNKWKLNGKQKSLSSQYCSVIIQAYGKTGQAYKSELRIK